MSGTTEGPPGPVQEHVAASEAPLLRRLRSGDESAFAELVDAWSPAMLRLARTFVGSQQTAEDVVQDAWLGFVHGIARFEGRSSLRTWTFSILMNRARTRGVREARTVPWSQVGPEDTAPTVDPGRFQGPDGDYPGHWSSLGAPTPWTEHPERALLAEEVRLTLEAAMQTLPPRQRSVVTLRDISGFSADEVCSVMGVSAENQRVLLHRARARLRGALEEYYRA